MLRLQFFNGLVFSGVFQPAIHTAQVFKFFTPVTIRAATIFTQVGVAVSTASGLHVLCITSTAGGHLSNCLSHCIQSLSIKAFQFFPESIIGAKIIKKLKKIRNSIFQVLSRCHPMSLIFIVRKKKIEMFFLCISG